MFKPIDGIRYLNNQGVKRKTTYSHALAVIILRYAILAITKFVPVNQEIPYVEAGPIVKV